MPTVLKVLTGNRGRRPLNDREPKPKAALPPAPDHLDLTARREWRRAAKALYDLGILSALDVATLAAYCSAVSDEIRFTRLLRRRGLMLKSKAGTYYVNPLVGMINRARADAVRYSTELGMTPASRTKVRVDEQPKFNPTEEQGGDEFLD